jgi:hypothetical protein
MTHRHASLESGPLRIHGPRWETPIACDPNDETLRFVRKPLVRRSSRESRPGSHDVNQGYAHFVQLVATHQKPPPLLSFQRSLRTSSHYFHFVSRKAVPDLRQRCSFLLPCSAPPPVCSTDDTKDPACTCSSDATQWTHFLALWPLSLWWSLNSSSSSSGGQHNDSAILDLQNPRRSHTGYYGTYEPRALRNTVLIAQAGRQIFYLR